MPKLGYNLNFNQLEAQNMVVQNLATAPSNPKEGQHYYNTADHIEYVWNGTQWVDALNQGEILTFSAPLAKDSNHNVTISDASNTSVGAIRIATDQEAETGTAELIAVNPKQLATKVDKLSSAPTAGTYSRVTINSDGQVTSGGDISIASGSSNYLTFTSSSGEISAKVDTTVTGSSTNLVTSGAVSSAISSALTGALIYQGTWTATSQTDYSSITLPVKKGYMYIVAGSATIGGVEWNAGDYLVINKDIAAGGTITGSDVDKIDNTEGSDIVRLNATQTLTNKTIDADDNTISDLTTSNFKSGVIVTTVGSTGSDSAIPTEQAVREAISATKVVATNPALTASGGICTWTVTAAHSPDVSCTIRETSGGAEVLCDVTYGSGSITIKINSASNISAGTYTAVVLG